MRLKVSSAKWRPFCLGVLRCVKMPLRCSYYIRHVGCCSLLRIYVVIWIFPVQTTCKMYYICSILIKNNMSIAKIKCCMTPMTTWYITFKALQIWIKTRTSFCYQLNLDKYNDRNYICNCKSCCIILKCFFYLPATNYTKVCNNCFSSLHISLVHNQTTVFKFNSISSTTGPQK